MPKRDLETHFLPRQVTGIALLTGQQTCYSPLIKLRFLYVIEIYKKIEDDTQSCHRRSDEANDQYMPK